MLSNAIELHLHICVECLMRMQATIIPYAIIAHKKRVVWVLNSQFERFHDRSYGIDLRRVVCRLALFHR